MNSKKLLSRLLTPLVLGFVIQTAHATSTTLTGTLSSDDQVIPYNFTSTTTQTYNFFTTSYGGGMNVNGTNTTAGGFVPVLTLFNANGTVIGPSSTGGAVDRVTGLSNDAFLTETLGPGSYILDLSEFPNVANGNLADGFLFAGQGNFTGGQCTGAPGSFLETDTIPCTQRTNNYSLNVATAATPEPATWLLVLPATGLFLVGRRYLA